MSLSLTVIAKRAWRSELATWMRENPVKAEIIGALAVAAVVGFLGICGCWPR